MAQIGNKINSVLNGEWAKHVRCWGKRETAGIRRMEGKEVIRHELNPQDDNSDLAYSISFEIMHGYFASMREADAITLCERQYKNENDKHIYPLTELIKNAA